MGPESDRSRASSRSYRARDSRRARPECTQAPLPSPRGVPRNGAARAGYRRPSPGRGGGAGTIYMSISGPCLMPEPMEGCDPRKSGFEPDARARADPGERTGPEEVER